MDEATTVPTYTLNDGNTIPAVGFGTYPLKGEDGIMAIVGALEAGYRLLDTAVNYDNEGDVAEALRRSALPREEVQVASKLPGRHHAYDDAVASVHGSLERLGLEYFDLHLIHWPNPSVDKYVEAWRALVDLQREGVVRSIGVSNFTEAHLTRIIEDSGVTPAVNQIELHPRYPQARMREVHERLGIRTEAWSPMGKRRARLEAGREPRTGDPPLARAGRLAAHPEVCGSAAPAAEPRRVRVRAHRGRGGRDLRARGDRRPALRRRSRPSRGDVTSRSAPDCPCPLGGAS